MCHTHKQSLLPMFLQEFSYKKQASKTMYRKTSGYGAQAVVGDETNVQMKNAQKHSKY